jgi:membrane-bound lytic murein transglycosylase D
VRRGETLSGIAVRYGVRMADLKSWNLLRGNMVRVGQRLVVRVPTRVAVTSGLEYYNVRRGDNLWAISSRFGSTVDELRRMNDGLSEDLQPGQRIRVR